MIFVMAGTTGLGTPLTLPGRGARTSAIMVIVFAFGGAHGGGRFALFG